MPTVELSAGPIAYADTGGDGPPLVFVHGVMMNGTGWRLVVDRLAEGYRCIVPDWPLGGHNLPMRPGADLSLRGIALLVGEFLERLDLTGVTLVQNDWGGVQVLLAEGPPEQTGRIGRVVLTACEAFDRYPPPQARPMKVLARIPGAIGLLARLLRWRPVQRAPMTWGAMSKRPVPAEVADGWFRPAATDPRIARDLAAYATSLPDRATLLDWAERAGTFAGPVLVVWATEDRMYPRAYGRRLAEQFPQGRLVEIDDSYTLITEDQPDRLTEAIETFLTATAETRPVQSP